MRSRNIIVFRVNKAQPKRFIGDISDIIDSDQYVGTKVDIIGEDFAQVIVDDMDEQLEEDFRSGIKRLKAPTYDNPLYAALLTHGKVTVTKELLLQYVEAV